jgi:hypothetical protein
MPVLKPLATIIFFFQLVALYHGTHGAVNDKDAFFEFVSDICHSLKIYALP